MRRTFDVIFSLASLLVMCIPTLIVAAAIRLSMGSPVLFKQERCGQYGRAFTIVKFRTMRTPAYDAEPDKDRLTSLGRFLRRASLDELPQLWNILRGDMSLIGPRPTLPRQVARYDERQRRRLLVRPGVTGWAQVSGRNSLSWPERIELDIWYIEHRSLGLDIRILARTVAQVIRPVGVTGEGGVNPDFPA